MITTGPFFVRVEPIHVMPRIKAFKALRPPAELAATVASVPYDVVNRAEAAALAEGNPNSFLHVVRPDIDLPDDVGSYDDAVYETAGKNLRQLVANGALVEDTEDRVFLYRQVMNGVAQTGLVCCSHVDDYENNRILKHEKTRPAKEDDRTRHVLTLNAHAGPVFLTYRDVAAVNEIVDAGTKQPPLYDFTAPDGVQHTVWQVDRHDELIARMSDVPYFYVADGHHRAASAWRAAQARKEANSAHTGDEEYNWFLTVLFPANQLKILAYNRVVKDLNGLDAGELVTKLGSVGKVVPATDPIPGSAGTFCMYVDGSWHEVTIPSERIDESDATGCLDVALLESLVLNPILGIEDVRTDPRIDFVGGIRGAGELEKLVDSGDWACAFSMYPTLIDQLMAVSDAGEVMPPKSTWFEPKLRSGLFVHDLG